MGGFRWAKRHFKTVQEFEAYVASLQRPDWLRGATVHHTWKPTVEQWQQVGGSRYMDSLERFYRTEVLNNDGSRGWTAGPNLFVGPDGIWQGTPITEQGIHAGPCNTSHLGIEVVGNYDLVEWAEPIKGLVLGVLCVLVRHQWITIPSIVGHRDCLANKSCPGAAIDMARVRQWVRETDQPRPVDRQVIGVPPSVSLEAWLRALRRNGGEMLLTEEEMRRVWTFCDWLDIDPAFVLAVWIREGSRPLGSSALQQRSRSPLNLKAAPGEWRPTVEHNGARWHAFQSFQLGLFAGVTHLKNEYGAKGELTVRQIANRFMREKTTTDAEVERYVSSVLEDMAYIQSH